MRSRISRARRNFFGLPPCRGIKRILTWIRTRSVMETRLLLLLIFLSQAGLLLVCQYAKLLEGDPGETLLAIQEASAASFHALTLWGHVVLLFLQPILQVFKIFSIFLAPLLAVLAEIFGNALAHAWQVTKNTDPWVLCSIFLVFLIFVLLWLLKRCIARKRYIPRLKARITYYRNRYVRMRNWLRQRYNAKFEAFRQRSRTLANFVATVVPHACFALLCVAVAYFFPEYFKDLTNQQSFVFLSVVFPSVFSWYKIETELHSANSVFPSSRNVEGDDEKNDEKEIATTRSRYASSSMKGLRQRYKQKDQEKEKKKKDHKDLENDADTLGQRFVERTGSSWILMYWVLFGVFTMVNDLGGDYILSYISWWPTAKCVLFCWLLLPTSDGVSIAYSVVVPLFDKHIKSVNLPKGIDAQHGNMILNGLVTMRVIHRRTAIKTMRIISDSGVILLALIFFFCPGSITRIGCLLVGYGFPTYSSIIALGNLASEAASLSQQPSSSSCSSPASSSPSFLSKVISSISRSKDDEQDQASSTSNEQDISATTRVRLWLKYWIILAIVTFCHDFITLFFGSLPLWFHIKLGLLMWLQLPYFRGAIRIYSFLMQELSKFSPDSSSSSSLSPSPSLSPRDDSKDNSVLECEICHEFPLRPVRFCGLKTCRRLICKQCADDYLESDAYIHGGRKCFWCQAPDCPDYVQDPDDLKRIRAASKAMSGK